MAKLWRKLSKKVWDEEKQIWVRTGRQLKMFTMGSHQASKGAIGLLGGLIKRLPDVSETLKRYEKKVKTNETK